MTVIGEERPLKRVKLDHDAHIQIQDKVPLSTRKSYAHIPDYGSGLHLAPMVRCGSLPTRLMSLEFGANLVWGPETIDRAMIGCTRTVDPQTGVVRYIKNDRTIWDTHPIEKERLIYQIGSADPDLAVQAAKMIENDVAGVDLNCGCPKPFSTSGNMGAALLSEPDRLCSILKALIENLSAPISCKIRLLPTQESTLDLVRQIASTGISCLTVHCRTKDMRPREPALLDRLEDIVRAIEPFGIPVIANGDCLGFQDVERVKKLTGVKAIMIARAAEANPSAFRSKGLLDYREILPKYVQIAHATGNSFGNTKYCINSMDFSKTPLREAGTSKTRKALKQAIAQSKDYKQLAAAVNGELLPDIGAWQGLVTFADLHETASL